MKITLLVLVIALASATTISPFAKLNYTKKRSLTAVMAEIESKIKSKSPLDAILNVLTEFRDAVNVE